MIPDTRLSRPGTCPCTGGRYARKVGREGGDHFLSFLKIIATKQRQEDVSSEQYKVTIEWKLTSIYNHLLQYFAEMMAPVELCVLRQGAQHQRGQQGPHQEGVKECEPWDYSCIFCALLFKTEDSM